MTRSLRAYAASSLILAAFATSAHAAITVKKASLSEGIITLRGTTEPGALITLDGGVATARANASGKFDFGNLSYVPQSCIAKLTAPGQTTALANVGNCDPIALKSRGEWNDATSYMTDELVFLNGSTWRAKKQVPVNIAPSDMNGDYWEVFAKGARAARVGPRALPVWMVQSARPVPQARQVPPVRQVIRDRLEPQARLVLLVCLACLPGRSTWLMLRSTPPTSQLRALH